MEHQPGTGTLKEIKSALDQPEPDGEMQVINSILNLRLIATVEWKDFFEETSVLDRTLQRDPARDLRPVGF